MRSSSGRSAEQKGTDIKGNHDGCSCGSPLLTIANDKCSTAATASHTLKLNAVIKNSDPTRTTRLRMRYVADMARRFNSIARLVKESVDTNDCFGLRKRKKGKIRFLQAIKPRAFEFTSTETKVKGFMDWLNTQVDKNILEITYDERLGAGSAPLRNPWQNVYIDTADDRGKNRARIELRKAGVVIPEKSLFEGAFFAPVHADRVGALYIRNYQGLKGITAAMDLQMSTTLADGLLAGANATELSRMLVDRVNGLGKGSPMSALTRAKMLARTEVIRAHHLGNIAEYRSFGVEGVKIKAEFSTAGFGVCPICADLEGAVMTLDKIELLIPVHPNCRCTALPIVSDDLRQAIAEGRTLASYRPSKETIKRITSGSVTPTKKKKKKTKKKKSTTKKKKVT